MSVSLDQIKELREATGVSMMVCKKALEETNGNAEKALDFLRKKGEAKAAERGIRSTGEGVIASYIHSNSKLGVLVKIGCETDFVAKNEDFQALAKDIAMHVAAMNPLTVSPDDVPENLIEKEREIWREQLINEGKKEAMLDNILAGKEKKFREEISLLTQPFVKDPERTVEKLIIDAVNKLGENIKIESFCRYSV
ncbi:elongation factor Ts [Patescibacteria group bacterium]|nr:elongation factor Ts [Patescibacteria group bacterium]MBU1702923.1 elongation factor Ts [Patescibacteria group bacterium]MBU1953487.1 elongation factor Ts [Patescibacteria group bacterium]